MNKPASRGKARSNGYAIGGNAMNKPASRGKARGNGYAIGSNAMNKPASRAKVRGNRFEIGRREMASKLNIATTFPAQLFFMSMGCIATTFMSWTSWSGDGLQPGECNGLKPILAIDCYPRPKGRGYKYSIERSVLDKPLSQAKVSGNRSYAVREWNSLTALGICAFVINNKIKEAL